MNGAPLYPEAAILDPALTLAPATGAAFTGIDALTHALEATHPPRLIQYPSSIRLRPLI